MVLVEGEGGVGRRWQAVAVVVVAGVMLGSVWQPEWRGEDEVVTGNGVSDNGDGR